MKITIEIEATPGKIEYFVRVNGQIVAPVTRTQFHAEQYAMAIQKAFLAAKVVGTIERKGW